VEGWKVEVPQYLSTSVRGGGSQGRRRHHRQNRGHDEWAGPGSARAARPIAERVPELRLDQHEIEWTTLDDGHEALLVDGGGIDGGSGTFFANAGDDLHAVGSMDPLVPGCVGCIVIQPDGSRQLARVVPDPLAE
jgi:hypothetical protein